MNRPTSLFTITFFIGLLFSSPLFAEKGAISASIKVGQSLVSDFEDDPILSQIDVDGDSAFGFNIAYGFAEQWDVEFEYITGGAKFSGGLRSVEVDFNTIAFYAAFRSEGQIYFAGRVGVLNETIESNVIPETESESGLSLGAGVGFRISPQFTLEADYTIVEQDLDWLLFSGRYTF